MNRRLITYVLLCTSLVVVVVAQMGFRRPGMWRWLQPEPSAVAVSTALSKDSHPGLEQTAGDRPRRAPFPILKTVAGAADLEPFLAPAKDALPELQASAKAELDASARYHLLQLARDAVVSSLEADARNDIRYKALVEKPGEYRGELVRIQGDLISLSEPMELQRKVPGMEVCYLGLMTNERPEHQYLVLFTDLPVELTKNQSEWHQLYRRQVQFAGYFYKVAKFTSPKNKAKTWMLPVLVGKSPILPIQSADSYDWLNLLTVFIAMAVPVVLVALIVPRYFRSSDAEHDSLMAEFKRRREEQVKQSLEQFPQSDDPGLRLNDDRG